MSQIKRKNKSQRHRARANHISENNTNTNTEEITQQVKTKKKKVFKEDVTNEVELKEKKVKFSPNVVDNEPEESPRKKLKRETDNVVIETRLPTSEELTECQKPENVKNVGSKRQMKKEKHEKLKIEQKLQSEVVAQQKSLNYLSLWKHNRGEWKFEKLRQVWLQQHMFDSLLVPDKFWQTLIEYFGGAKGQIRQVVLKDCLKIVEESDQTEATDEKSQSKSNKIRFTRARNLLQCLEE